MAANSGTASGWAPRSAAPLRVLEDTDVALWIFDELRLVAASRVALDALELEDEAWEFPLRALLEGADGAALNTALTRVQYGSPRETVPCLHLVGRSGVRIPVAAEVLLLGPSHGPLVFCRSLSVPAPPLEPERSPPESRVAARAALCERLATLGTLAAGLIHEINDPLAYVSLSLAQLERDVLSLVPEAERDKLLARIDDARHGADRIATLARDVRAFARDQGDERRPVAVLPLLESALRITDHQLSRAARVRVELRDAAWVSANAVQLEHVFINLLVNAAQAIPPSGPRGLIEVSAALEAPELFAVEVRDDGEGIPSEDLERVFEAFFTTKSGDAGRGGTGLGLAFCRRIVRSLGGRLSVSSVVGEGSRFRVELPTVPPPTVPPLAVLG
jgi:signal transduction histidine kinase